MSTRRVIRAIAPGAVHSRPKDGVAEPVIGTRDFARSRWLACARPDAALILGGLLLLICP